MWKRISTWRFAALVAVAVVDAAIFVLPVTPVVLVIAALIAPDTLRAAARFLNALADGAA